MEEINSENDHFVNPDGFKLFRMIYQPISLPIEAVVFVSHGLFEHCQAAYLETIIQPLNAIGCMVITHDHIGHGLSEGKPGIIFSIESLVRDVLFDIDETLQNKNIDKNIPIFIYGHSMGGLIAVHASLTRKGFFTGMCLESPALIFPSKVGKTRILMAKIISRLFPSLSLGKIDYNDICRNTEYLNIVKNDKLRIHEGVPSITIISLYNSIEIVRNSLVNVDTPFIVGHGDKDELCEIEGSKMLMGLCKIADKTFVAFPGAKHQLRMEIENINVKFSKDIVDWINFRIKN